MSVVMMEASDSHSRLDQRYLVLIVGRMAQENLGPLAGLGWEIENPTMLVIGGAMLL